MVAKPGWHLDVRTRGLWPVVVNMSAHAALSKIRLKKKPNLCPCGVLVTAITWFKTVTFYLADIPWPLLMARSAVLTRTHALILSAGDTKPNNAFFPRTHNLPVSRETTQTLFPLHPPSPVPCSSCKERQFWHLYCFVRSSTRFKSHGYTQCDPTPTQKSARKW